LLDLRELILAGFDADMARPTWPWWPDGCGSRGRPRHRYDPALTVSATFELSPDALTIRIADSGPGLDPAQISGPAGARNLLRSSAAASF